VNIQVETNFDEYFPSLFARLEAPRTKKIKQGGEGEGALMNNGQMFSTWLFVHAFPSREEQNA
jgi:hypothetical protein